MRKEVTTVRVADLTIEELRALIKEAVQEELRELWSDPDKGLELRPELEERLQSSLASKERISFDEVQKKLHLR